jgi:hypothetical protein
MKKEIKKRKLQLQKKTITLLNDQLQAQINGGETTTACDTYTCMTTDVDDCTNKSISLVNPRLCLGGTIPR